MKFRFSSREIKDLIKAWLAITIAFTILKAGIFSDTFLHFFIISAIAVGLGFVLHELAHKFMAQKYGLFAEFRSFDFMLILAILMSFIGFILVAPGAVMIRGWITRVRNGKISFAGPATNFVLAIIFLTIFYFGILTELASYGAFINTWIGLFNMIPFGNIDGKKILNWNKPVYIVTVIIGVALLVITGQIVNF